ncbi:toll/interleukin-1 receptor domain-containing protein [Deinococcus sp. ME38]|uniref:toll/interleukin-1 receptor domain-containing protein n=1 Tax=Deinococcus sp. ME38 TaxID=3400344 RepID=UPI003B5C7920
MTRSGRKTSPADKKVLFISHSTQEKEVALALQATLNRAFIGTFEIFVFSDNDSVTMGSDFEAKIRSALQRSFFGLCLFTPESLKRPWINIEFGALWFAGIPAVPVCFGGQSVGTLPPPYGGKNGLDAINVEALDKLLANIAQQAGLSVPTADWPPFLREVRRFNTRVGTMQFNPQRDAHLVSGIAHLFRLFPAGSNPHHELLSGPVSFTLAHTDPLTPSLEALEEAGWITQTILGDVVTDEGPGVRLNLQATSQFSKVSRDPTFQAALQTALSETSPVANPTPVPAQIDDHRIVTDLMQSKWGLPETLDGLVRDGQRQRLTDLLTAVLTEPEWTRALYRWLETSPAPGMIPWLLELLMDGLSVNLTAINAFERLHIVRLVMTAAIDAHRGEEALYRFQTLLAGLSAQTEWTDAHRDLLVEGMLPFWLNPDGQRRAASDRLEEQRDDVLRHVLRAAQTGAARGRSSVTNGIWTALGMVLHRTRADDVLTYLIAVEGVQDQRVMVTLQYRTLGTLLNAGNRARFDNLSPEEQTMRHRLIRPPAKVTPHRQRCGCTPLQ